jgi:hypothetical protein
MGAGAVWSVARLIQRVKMGAVPAKISGARPSRLATSDFNDGCSAEKLEFNLWRVDARKLRAAFVAEVAALYSDCEAA